MPTYAIVMATPIPEPEHNQQGARRLLSQTELAKALQVCKLTVSRWTTARIIPCHRVGRIIRYDLAAVLAAIAKAENKKGDSK
jgi:excisionase family DNA binding protein